MKTRIEEKLTFWGQKLQEYRESGLSRKAFCEGAGIKRSALDYWFTRINKAQKAEGLVELMPVSLSAVVSEPIQIVVAGRYRIEVRRGFDAQVLAGVVRVLETGR